MKVSRWLIVPMLVLAAVSAGPAGADRHTDQPTIDAAVQVTQNPAPARGHVMPDIAVHPSDPNVLAVIDGEARTAACGVSVSTDAGLTWRPAAPLEAPNRPKCVWSTLGPFAAVTFGPTGTLFAAFTGYPTTHTFNHAYLARSTDLGATWSVVEMPGQEADYERGLSGMNTAADVVVDPNNPDRVYVSWWINYNAWMFEEILPKTHGWFIDYPGRPMLAVSDDGGQTFRGPVDAGAELPLWLTEPRMLVGNDGELYVFFGDWVDLGHEGVSWAEYGDDAKGHLYVSISRDGGTTFAVKELYTRGLSDGWAWSQGATGGVDRETGDVYVAWEATGPGPTGGVEDAGPAAIKFIRSSDQGETWSDPIDINDVEPARGWSCCTYLPRMSIAPNGRLDVAWYDFRNDVAYDPVEEENRFADVYYRYSEDGGRTWAPSLRVTDRAFDTTFGPASENFGIKGPLGIASTNDAAYIAWQDTRAGDPQTESQDIYFTRARFGAAVPLSESTTSGWNNPALAGATGAAAALALAGVMLLLARRRTENGSV